MSEHKALLVAGGYSDHRRQGSVHKYSGYLRRIMLEGEFESRSDLFEAEARGRAESVCWTMAGASSSTNSAGVRKLYKNYMRGFTTFVRLAGN